MDRRLARLLLAEARAQGTREGAILTVDLEWTHQRIAARIGSVREAVSRGFARLQQHGLVEVRGHQLTVRSEDALTAYCRG